MLLKNCFILIYIVMHADCLYIGAERDSWPNFQAGLARGEDFIPAGLSRQSTGYQTAGAQETVIVMPNQGYPTTRGSYGSVPMNREETIIVNRNVPGCKYGESSKKKQKNKMKKKKNKKTGDFPTDWPTDFSNTDFV